MIVGSANVSEIELSRYLTDEWATVLNWLRRVDLLRSGVTCPPKSSPVKMRLLR
jgi:hypothetical protein